MEQRSTFNGAGRPVTTRRMAFATTGLPRPPVPGMRSLFDEMFVKRYDASLLKKPPTSGGLRQVPSWFQLAQEIRRRELEYDVVVTWNERATVALMALDGVARSPKKPHVAMLYWFSRPFIRFPMQAFGDRLQAIITWSSVQRRYAIERLGFPSEKLYLIRHYAEDHFWSSPQEVETDMICSAGAEMRDYPTLLEALRGTDLRCHIAADHVRTSRVGFGGHVGVDSFAAGASDNVTIGRKSMLELRELYARSRFVVVPLLRSDTDNGVTVILEAMSMGKPVICSRTRGQVDVIQEGVTGLFVPVNDPVALRSAMLELWNDPERARAMGLAARAYVEKHHALDKFCRDVRTAIDASLDGKGAAPDGSFA
jgi:glycosyltransferase involved in cell wall biosynthesis